MYYLSLTGDTIPILIEFRLVASMVSSYIAHAHGVGLRTVSRAGGQHAARGVGFGLVHREIVLALDLHDPVHVPALVQGRQPLRQVLVDLLVPVHAGAGQGEVEQVVGEGAPGVAAGAAEAAVVRLATGYDVFDVRLSDAGEIGAGVRAVDAVALLVDDMGLDALGVGIEVRVVVRAAVFGLDAGAQVVDGRDGCIRNALRASKAP